MTTLEVSGSMTATTPARASAVMEFDRQVQAEHAMARASIVGFLISLPIAIVVLVGMMAVAIGADQPWYVWIGLGVGMGVYAAGFLGTVGGVLLSARSLNRIADGHFV